MHAHSRSFHQIVRLAPLASFHTRNAELLRHVMIDSYHMSMPLPALFGIARSMEGRERARGRASENAAARRDRECLHSNGEQAGREVEGTKRMGYDHRKGMNKPGSAQSCMLSV